MSENHSLSRYRNLFQLVQDFPKQLANTGCLPKVSHGISSKFLKHGSQKQKTPWLEQSQLSYGALQ